MCICMYVVHMLGAHACNDASSSAAPTTLIRVAFCTPVTAAYTPAASSSTAALTCSATHAQRRRRPKREAAAAGGRAYSDDC